MLIALRCLDFGKVKVGVRETFDPAVVVSAEKAEALQARLLKAGHVEIFIEGRSYSHLTERPPAKNPAEILGQRPASLGKIPPSFYTGSGRNSY
jgi:hypothetical protein